jgi:hypothetical protein
VAANGAMRRLTNAEIAKNPNTLISRSISLSSASRTSMTAWTM